MRYFSKTHTESEAKQITGEKALYYLEGCYAREAIEEVIEKGKPFRLQTPFRDVWTEDEQGNVPESYGICD